LVAGITEEYVLRLQIGVNQAYVMNNCNVSASSTSQKVSQEVITGNARQKLLCEALDMTIGKWHIAIALKKVEDA
jgi:hypothetical protein